MCKKVFVVVIFVSVVAFFYFNRKSDLPIIAIANYGRHASLDSSIKGLKACLAESGFIENKNIRYEISDVGFDSSLIPQMIAKLMTFKPKIIVVKTTPVAQFAKGKVHNIPLVYCDITDPVEAGLIENKTHSNENVTGSSDMQDLDAFLAFAKSVLPKAKTIGLLYSTSESNDTALIKIMRQAASNVGMSVFAVPVDQARDIQTRVQKFKGKVDFIYVGTSGPIQPALPTIALEAQKMKIPIFNAEDQAVHDGLALASFGVNYESVGRNAGKLIVRMLSDISVKKCAPIYPSYKDHRRFINKKQAAIYMKGSTIEW